MPANLPPHYFVAEEHYRSAKTPQEKIEALREMWAIMPKHKGTEKLQADIKRRISRHQEEAQQPRKAGRREYLGYVAPEGAGQVVLVGPPNVGKSALLATMTNARPEVAPYPYTTHRPLPGMMHYEDIQVQLIDIPPISPEYMEGWVPNLVRMANLALSVVDLSNGDPSEQMMMVLDVLEKSNIRLGRRREGDAQEMDLTQKAVLVGNKLDLPQARERAEQLKEIWAEEFPILLVSATERLNIDLLQERIFQELDVIRVYTKEPGKKPDLRQPYVLPRGSTIMDVARTIHRDFVERLRYARIWGSEKYDGQQVQRDHVVMDKDIVEFHL